jgi:hypothetical protein
MIRNILKKQQSNSQTSLNIGEVSVPKRMLPAWHTPRDSEDKFWDVGLL